MVSLYCMLGGISTMVCIIRSVEGVQVNDIGNNVATETSISVGDMHDSDRIWA